ncbi:extracellular solute-binding protein [Cohnella thailandensis]|uniref:Sugar ABC transporter substrate-binding protein n=1 Tax=Cohnella thailandensis TaxID=557557 RepID=A0A841T491_9BACL|nr:sugar ABC transporter substrate-binding protein [Cohnella thailandensis]MBP1976319.1 multiple sugar transport system substrate-binding protein [Cohnella thailandensis]
MVKQWGYAALGATLVIGLTACSSSGNEGASPDASNSGAASASASGQNAGEKTKIAYWTPDRHDAVFMQAKIDEFNKTNTDNIEVEMTVMADNYPDAVDIAFASKQAPDVLRINNLETYVKKGYITPLNSYMDDATKERFSSVLIENKNMIGGEIYSLPNTGQTWRLIYNKDLFAKAGLTEAPKTLDELVEYAKKITEAGKAEGAYGFASNFKSSSGFWRPSITVSTASGTTGAEGYNFQTGQFDFNSVKDIALALRQMKEDGSMLPGVESLDMDPLRAQFAQGKIGMYINHSGEPSVYKDQFPTTVNWAAAPPPTADGTIHGAINVVGGWYVGISNDSPNKEKAWKFLEYLYSLDLQKEYYENGYGVSLIPDVIEAASSPSTPGIEGFLPTKYDALYPDTPLTATEAALEGTKYGDVLTKYVVVGGDLDKLIEDLNTRYNAALAKARADGTTKIEADPDFDASKLQGALAQ